MVVVTYDQEKGDFSSALSYAAVVNTLKEIEMIVDDIKSKSYNSHVDLIRDLKRHIDDLDPCDKKSTVSCILENIHPEQRNLLDPVNIILYSKEVSNPKRKMFGCFSVETS